MCAAPNAFVNLLPAKKVVRYRPDEVIFSQGGPCGEVFYIEEGLVKLTTVSNRGRGAVLGILGHGDFLGEECLSSETHHQASAVALVPTSIVVTKRRNDAAPDRARPRHRRSPDRIPAASQSPHRGRFDRPSLQLQREKRLARTLLLLNEHGKRTNSPSILERISQDTLADMVGTTRSRVNFFMNKFRKLGFIRYNGGVKIYNSLQSLLQD